MCFKRSLYVSVEREMKTKVVDGLERKIDRKKYLGFNIQLGFKAKGNFSSF